MWVYSILYHYRRGPIILTFASSEVRSVVPMCAVYSKTNWVSLIHPKWGLLCLCAQSIVRPIEFLLHPKWGLLCLCAQSIVKISIWRRDAGENLLWGLIICWKPLNSVMMKEKLRSYSIMRRKRYCIFILLLL